MRTRFHRTGSIAMSIALVAFFSQAVSVMAGQAELSAVRQATARFHDLDAAQAAGYGVTVADLAGITCIAQPGVGAMGIHHLNPSLTPELFDANAVGSVDAMTPELLVYAPGPNGQQRLVALEYLVLRANWDPYHVGRPSLFGQEFNLTLAGNRFGLPAYYSLHAWVWNPNPTSMFAPWNPRVTCP